MWPCTMRGLTELMPWIVHCLQVRCQADGLGAGEVIRQLLKGGAGPKVVQQLYSGFASAALFSMVVGAVHWLSFCAAKRTAMDVLSAPSTTASTAKAAALSTSSSHTSTSKPTDRHGSSSAAASSQSNEQASISGAAAASHLHVSSDHHVHDETLSAAQGEGGCCTVCGFVLPVPYL